MVLKTLSNQLTKMPKTKVIDGCPMKKMRSFKTEPAATKYRESCNKRGYFARVVPQSGPRIKNPYAVYAARTCPGKGKFGKG